MSLWGLRLDTGKETEVTIEEGNSLHISGLTLDLNAQADKRFLVKLHRSEGDPLVIGSVGPHQEHCSVDILLAENFKLSVGTSQGHGSVHLIGAMCPMDYGDEDLSSDYAADEFGDIGDEDEEDEEEESEEAPRKKGRRPRRDFTADDFDDVSGDEPEDQKDTDSEIDRLSDEGDKWAAPAKKLVMPPPPKGAQQGKPGFQGQKPGGKPGHPQGKPAPAGHPQGKPGAPAGQKPAPHAGGKPPLPNTPQGKPGGNTPQQRSPGSAPQGKSPGGAGPQSKPGTPQGKPQGKPQGHSPGNPAGKQSPGQKPSADASHAGEKRKREENAGL